MKIAVSGVAVRQKGFTLVEVMIALTMLVAVMSGMTMALTASMQLGVQQNQRSLAQDIARNVNNRWLKTVSFDWIYPAAAFDGGGESSYYGAGSTPYTVTLFDNGSVPQVNKLEQYHIASLGEELNRLPYATLDILISPIKVSSAIFAKDKVNATIRVQWGKPGGATGRREITMANVVGAGDIGRAPRTVMLKPMQLTDVLPGADEDTSLLTTVGETVTGLLNSP